MIRATDWSEVLFPIIPERRLAASVQLAFENHTGAFPINAYDIKNAYEIVKANTPKDPYCYNYDNHLHGEPEIFLYIPGVTETDVIVPCGGCRPEEFRAMKTTILQAAGKPDRTVTEILADLGRAA